MTTLREEKAETVTYLTWAMVQILFLIMNIIEELQMTA